MEYTIDELRNKIFENVFSVCDVFRNHFGEQHTDLQGIPDSNRIMTDCSYDSTIETEGDKYSISDNSLSDLIHLYDRQYYTIYVWWPDVTVTNENDRSISIQDLYAQIRINIDGCIPYEYYGFLLNRSTYSDIQFISDYLHSHIAHIPKSDFSRFQEPCLGRGPIKETINTLKGNNDPVIWMLFCEELSRYVTVESLTGIPYKHLEQVGKYKPLAEYQYFRHADSGTLERFALGNNNSQSPYYLSFRALKAMLIDFMAYYLRNGHLSFSFRFHKFICGMSYYEYMIDVSNCFISYYNEKMKEDDRKIKYLYSSKFLLQVLVINGKFNVADYYDSNALLDSYRNQHVLTFRGNDIRTVIKDSNGNSEATVTTILNWKVAMYILDNILNIINFRFTNEHTNNGARSTEGSKEATPKTRETVCYL